MHAVRTVAVEAGDLRPRFPDVVRSASGDLFVVYHAATEHAGVRGTVRAVRSSDDGATWGEPVTVMARERDARDPKVATLSDGTLLLTWFESQWTGKDWEHERFGPFAARSSDHGVTWSDPVPVGTRLMESGGWAALHGPAVELPGGDILQPLYGQPYRSGSGPKDWTITAARSRDGGRSFDAEDEYLIAHEADFRFAEPNLSVLADGSLAALLRVQEPGHLAYLTRSGDGGRTWSTPERTDLPARSHHQLVTSAGEVLLTYGDQDQEHRPTCGVLLTDPLRPWTVAGALTLHDAGHWDQANPSSVELADGQFLTLSVDVANAAVVGVMHRREDYLASGSGEQAPEADESDDHDDDA